MQNMMQKRPDVRFVIDTIWHFNFSQFPGCVFLLLKNWNSSKKGGCQPAHANIPSPFSKWEGTYCLRPNGWSALHTIAFWMLVNKHPCGTGPNGNTESAVVKGREVEVVGNDLLKHLSKQGYLLLLCFHLFSSLEWQPLGWEENRIL